MIAWQIIEQLWREKRDLLSDGYDRALAQLGELLPMSVLEVPSGTECFTWIVPDAWHCDEAYLETMDGQRLFSYADHPLHVVSYSLPFEGVVSRETLAAHLHVHPRLPEAIPFVFKYYDREWGLCCSRDLKDQLSDPEYRVVIRTRFQPSTLKVGQVLLEGETDELVVLCAHLCHPHQFNDDLTGVAVGMELMRRLGEQDRRHYSYLLLVLPESIGSVAWLSQNMDRLPKIRGGLFLESLGLSQPHALQLSYQGQTQIDRAFSAALTEADPDGHIGPFMTVVRNDDRQFNAPGIRVPMLSLSRCFPSPHPDWPYRENHSSLDTPELASPQVLAQSVEVALQLMLAFERNLYPVAQFAGEIFLSRYGLADYLKGKQIRDQFMNIMFDLDGQHSLADIACRHGIVWSELLDVIDRLEQAGLVALRRTPASAPR